MPDSRIFEGKTTNEAIEKGLKELKLSRNDVNIKVFENEDKRSFFDILSPRIVKVELTLKEKKADNIVIPKKEIIIDKSILENTKNKIEEFVSKFLKTTVGEKTEFKCYIEENVVKVGREDEKADFLIGYRGETLRKVWNSCLCRGQKWSG